MKFKDFYESFSPSCWEQDSKKFHQSFERSLVMVLQVAFLTPVFGTFQNFYEHAQDWRETFS